MSYTVGLDFGTHQTKVCIEDASNPAQKIYEFFEFETPEKNKTVLLPSIVQINNDNTVSYGFIDETKCKKESFLCDKPVLILPQKPILELPQKPEKKAYPPEPQLQNLKGYSMKDQLFFIHKDLPYKKYQREKICKKIDEDYDNEIEDWNLECNAIEVDYNYDLVEYEKEKEERINKYEYAKAQWEKDSLEQEQIFRYFKLATFSNQSWKYKIKPHIISIWYLTFIFFKIQDKYGNDFYTQMGIPSGIETVHSKRQKVLALRIIVSANLLIDVYKNIDNFLKAKYTDLLDNTKFVDCTEEDKFTYGIDVIPEAFAGLTSVIKQGKLTKGIHLLVDIGGGTTDIALFSINEEKLPNIYAVFSFPKGLNYIFEKYLNEKKQISISKLQRIFRENQTGFENYISFYHQQLKDETDKIVQIVEQIFSDRKKIHGFNLSKLRDALKNQPIVYCGGGSMYNLMRIPLTNFTDVRLINKGLLSIPYISNKYIDESLFTILATSYGLSIQLESEIKNTPIEKIFDHLPKKQKETLIQDHTEHGMSDT